MTVAENKRWTIETLRGEAKRLGKPFDPNPEIADRLEDDLANPGTLVFFDEEGVRLAVKTNQVPRGLQANLVELVTERNDIAILPPDMLEKYKAWEETQAKASFLFQKNC